MCWLMKTTVHVHLRYFTVEWYPISSGMLILSFWDNTAVFSWLTRVISIVPRFFTQASLSWYLEQPRLSSLFDWLKFFIPLFSPSYHWKVTTEKIVTWLWAFSRATASATRMHSVTWAQLCCSYKYCLFYLLIYSFLLIYLLIYISLHRYLTSTEADDALPQEKRMRIFFHVFAGLPVSIKSTCFFNSLLSALFPRPPSL